MAAGLKRTNEIARLLVGQPTNALAPRVGSLTTLAGLFRLEPPRNALGLLGLLKPQKEPRTYPCFELYVDDKGEWRWRYRAANYKIIADSAEGYHNYDDAKHGMELMRECFKSPFYFGDK